MYDWRVTLLEVRSGGVDLRLEATDGPDTATNVRAAAVRGIQLERLRDCMHRAGLPHPRYSPLLDVSVEDWTVTDFGGEVQLGLPAIPPPAGKGLDEAWTYLRTGESVLVRC